MQAVLPINNPNVTLATQASINSTEEKCECLKCQIGRNFKRSVSRGEKEEADRYFKMMRSWVWWSAVMKTLGRVLNEADMIQALMDFGMTNERPTMPGNYRACLFSLNIATLAQTMQHVRLSHEMIDGEMTINAEKVKAFDEAAENVSEEKDTDESQG